MKIIGLDGSYTESLEELLKNRTRVISENLIESVGQIIGSVRQNGDRALAEFTRLYDGVALGDGDLRVTKEEIEKAYSDVGDDFLKALRRARDNIYDFHIRQLERCWFDKKDGVFLGQMINPIDSVGIYVPGGTARYPSSVLMNAVPAKVAGVKRIVMITPPGREGIPPEVLVAASEAGVHEVYRVGGAQGIAALAYGTPNIPAVDKITGPGNIYVALAKRLVFGDVGIDMIAGPSEVLIIADSGANPAFAAADMLAQAEHDAMASCILITDREKLIRDVESELKGQLDNLPRKDTAQQALEDYGALILVKNMKEACVLSNRIAPEHLGLMVREPMALLGEIRHAGAVFLGDYSPEALGDYMAGPNHVLPTGSTARFASPLGVEQFLKRTNLVYYSSDALTKVAGDISVLARGEGLSAHSRAVDVRCGGND
ncbi:MAG: histidinol dehydrogenase [Bacillota bacterium]|nr:histidinol dehydrogenase [Bacillota bacterium]MDD3298695.1 histidinol dehydrogenase [Bacillota bacterium]MDD3851134.1 histidinol dehydrogenase [Bacillota bacterium]MDD4706941.1 histidinol dehydrogenase [Bacillota bacterium]